MEFQHIMMPQSMIFAFCEMYVKTIVLNDVGNMYISHMYLVMAVSGLPPVSNRGKALTASEV